MKQKEECKRKTDEIRIQWGVKVPDKEEIQFSKAGKFLGIQDRKSSSSKKKTPKKTPKKTYEENLCMQVLCELEAKGGRLKFSPIKFFALDNSDFNKLEQKELKEILLTTWPRNHGKALFESHIHNCFGPGSFEESKLIDFLPNEIHFSKKMQKKMDAVGIL